MERFDRPYAQLTYEELDGLLKETARQAKYLTDYTGWEHSRYWHRSAVARCRNELNGLMREVHHRAIDEYRQECPKAVLYDNHVYRLEISPPLLGRVTVQARTRRGDQILADHMALNVFADRTILEQVLIDCLRRVYRERAHLPHTDRATW